MKEAASHSLIGLYSNAELGRGSVAALFTDGIPWSGHAVGCQVLEAVPLKHDWSRAPLPHLALFHTSLG